VVEVRNDGAGDRNDEPLEAVVDIEEAVCEDATELRPRVGKLLHARALQAGRTAFHSLLEHPMNHIWAMACQQGLDVSHGLIVNI
jgi:hypothetical protein